jgi:hypothetical protein
MTRRFNKRLHKGKPMKRSLIASVAGFAIVAVGVLAITVRGSAHWAVMPESVFSLISWEQAKIELTGCDQGPSNLPSSATQDLDEDVADWGTFCEGSPTWAKENVTTPSIDGRALRCSITGGAPYSNVHCYRNLLSEPLARTFALTVSFMFTPTTTCNNQRSPSVIQALEFSTSKWYRSKRYELALQWQNVEESPGDGAPQWRYWDPHRLETNRWVPISPTFTQCLGSGQWYTLKLEGEIVDGQVHYQSFCIDTQCHSFDITIPPDDAPNELDRLAVAVQLDGNFEEAPYDVFIDLVNFVRKPAAQIYLPLILK